MKIRWTRRGVRLRIDDLELSALRGGDVVHEELSLNGGGWSVRLSVGDAPTLEARGADLHVTLSRAELDVLLQTSRDGVERAGEAATGSPRLTVEKDFLPEHLGGA